MSEETAIQVIDVDGVSVDASGNMDPEKVRALVRSVLAEEQLADGRDLDYEAD